MTTSLSLHKLILLRTSTIAYVPIITLVHFKVCTMNYEAYVYMYYVQLLKYFMCTSYVFCILLQ